jgi:hypothetical protein
VGTQDVGVIERYDCGRPGGESLADLDVHRRIGGQDRQRHGSGHEGMLGEIDLGQLARTEQPN